MSRNPYWTPVDKKIFECLKGEVKQFFNFIKKSFSFNSEEILICLFIVIGIGIRLKGLLAAPLLLDEHHLIRQALGLSSFSSSFKYVSDSFYGILLMIPSLLTVVYGTAKGWFSVFLLINPEGIVQWAYPLFIYSGRIFGLVLFAVTVVLFYQLGKRYYNKQVGCFIALLLIFSPISLKSSQFVLSQNLSLLLGGGLFYLLFMWYEKKSPLISLLLGLSIGLFSATTFHGIYLLPLFIVLLAVFSWKQSLILLGGAVLAYFFGTIYAHFDLPLRLDNIAHQILLRRDYYTDNSHLQILSLWGRELSWFVLGTAVIAIVFLYKSKWKKFLIFIPFIYSIYFYFLFSTYTLKAPADLLLVLFPLIILSSVVLDHIVSLIRLRFFKKVLYLMVVITAMYSSKSAFSDFSPLSFEVEKSTSERNYQFTPGKWTQDHILPPPSKALWKSYHTLTYIRPMDRIQQKAIKAYSPDWTPVSLRDAPLVVSFIATESYLKEIRTVVKALSRGDYKMSVMLYNERGVQLAEINRKIASMEGWNDIVFEVNQPFEKGKKYYLMFDKTDRDVLVLKSQNDVILDMSILDYDPEVALPENKDKNDDVLFRLVYK